MTRLHDDYGGLIECHPFRNGVYGMDSSIKPIVDKQHSAERPETFGGWSCRFI